MGIAGYAIGNLLLFVLLMQILGGNTQFLRDDAENPRVDQGLIFQLKTLLEKQDKLMDKQESRLSEQDKRISLLENYVVDMHRDIQFLGDFVRTYINDSSAEVNSTGPSEDPTPAPRFQPNDEFIEKISGTWTFLYSDGIEGKFNISKTGLITLLGEKNWGEVYIAPSNNDDDFPSEDGWLMATTSFRGVDSWEYYRLNKDSTLEMQSIWKDGCKAKIQRCFSGTGVKGIDDYEFLLV